jgi:hypothetical protein
MAEMTKQRQDQRIDDLEHACAMLVTFPGMRKFVGNRIYNEVADLLGPLNEEPLDVKLNEG